MADQSEQYSRGWDRYPVNYREKEMAQLMEWVNGGMSAAVLGLPGMGKSNFLGVLCHRPDVRQRYTQSNQSESFFVRVDLNNLVDDTLLTFYRVILRSIFYGRQELSQILATSIEAIYHEYIKHQDAFLVQTALYDFIYVCQENKCRLVLVFDRFDDFCLRLSSPAMNNTLRGFRDSFKNTLVYIMVMRRDIIFVSEQLKLGELYELVDMRICWLDKMSDSDMTWMIQREEKRMKRPVPTVAAAEIKRLAGGWPAFVRALLVWYLRIGNDITPKKWLNSLAQEQMIQHRADEIVQALSQEELFVLEKAVQKNFARKAQKQHASVLQLLAQKGICAFNEKDRAEVNVLVREYMKTHKVVGRGKIWFDQAEQKIYQGVTEIDAELTELERNLLLYFLKNPLLPHNKDDLIDQAWPSAARRKGVSDDSLYQAILSLRRKIEPRPSSPCYLTHRTGQLDGGYQFFPEGRPQA